MNSFFTALWEGLLGNVVGGSTSESTMLTVLVVMMFLVFMLMVAKLDFIPAVAIVAPGAVVAALHGAVDPSVFGTLVIILGIGWGMIILALFK